jgi:hypothetical protein
VIKMVTLTKEDITKIEEMKSPVSQMYTPEQLTYLREKGIAKTYAEARAILQNLGYLSPSQVVKGEQPKSVFKQGNVIVEFSGKTSPIAPRGSIVTMKPEQTGTTQVQQTTQQAQQTQLDLIKVPGIVASKVSESLDLTKVPGVVTGRVVSYSQDVAIKEALPEKKIEYYPLTETYKKIPEELSTPKDVTTAEDVINAIKIAQMLSQSQYPPEIKEKLSQLKPEKKDLTTIQAEISKEAIKKTAEVVNAPLTLQILGKPIEKVEKIETPTQIIETKTIETPVREITIKAPPKTKLEQLTQTQYELTPIQTKLGIVAAAGASIGLISVAFPEIGSVLTIAGTYQIVKTASEAIKQKSLEPFKSYVEPETLAFMAGATGAAIIAQALMPPKVEVVTLPKGKEAIQPLLGYEKTKYGIEYLKKTEIGTEERIFIGSYSGWVKGKPMIVSEELTRIVSGTEPKIKSVEIKTTKVTITPEIFLKRIMQREYYYDPVQATEQGLSQAEETIKPLGYETIKPEPIITKEPIKPSVFFPIFPTIEKGNVKIFTKEYTKTEIKKEIKEKIPEIREIKLMVEPGINTDIGKEIGTIRTTDIDQKQRMSEVQKQAQQTEQATQTRTETKVGIETPVIKPPVFVFKEKVPKPKVEIEKQFRRPSLKVIEKYKPSFYSLERGLKLSKEMKKIEKEIKKAIWRPKL